MVFLRFLLNNSTSKARIEKYILSYYFLINFIRLSNINISSKRSKLYFKIIFTSLRDYIINKNQSVRLTYINFKSRKI